MNRLQDIRVLAALTCLAFLLVCGAWFGLHRMDGPWEVTTTRQDEVRAPEEAVSWPVTMVPGESICLNCAPEKDLQRLPGIGESRAAAIAAYREEHGPFSTLEELVLVPGIGEGLLEQLRPYISLD